MTTSRDQSVIDLLLEQHKQVKECFEQLKSGTGSKEAQFHKLVRLLAMHESAEEQIVHPAAHRAQAGPALIESRLQEEHEAKYTLAELYDLGVDHPDFDKKLSELADEVVDHAEYEETYEFAALTKHFSQDELRRMATAVRAAEAIAPTRYPHAGESAVGNLLEGPPLAVFDRVRDAMRDWRITHNQ
jgi:hypothetical protein